HESRWIAPSTLCPSKTLPVNQATKFVGTPHRAIQPATGILKHLAGATSRRIPLTWLITYGKPCALLFSERSPAVRRQYLAKTLVVTVQAIVLVPKLLLNTAHHA
ncbi:MAG TPA: hypothetical protein VGC74_16080, partial [Stenotrophomonas sp.]